MCGLLVYVHDLQKASQPYFESYILQTQSIASNWVIVHSEIEIIYVSEKEIFSVDEYPSKHSLYILL